MTLNQTHCVSRSAHKPRPDSRLEHCGLIVVGVCAALLLSACQSTPERAVPTITQRAYQPAELASSPSHETHLKQTDADAFFSEQARNNPRITKHAASPTSPANWLSSIDDEFAFARQLVEKELNVDLKAVSLNVVDDSPINTEVKFETQQLIKAQFGDSAFAKNLLQSLVGPLKGSYAALYSSRHNAIMISRSMLDAYQRSLSSGDHIYNQRAALQTLLIHELVHAADDLRYQIHENRILSFRASFAQSATFEGHAQWVTRNICEQAGCREGLDALDNFMFGNIQPTQAISQSSDDASRNVLEYSYVEGERFINELSKRPNGDQLIEELLSAPPLDPVQILSPESFPDKQREIRNRELINTSLSVNHIWNSSPWTGVETSPLKGVNLRSDPERRRAAVDGFTRLIQSMISIQFYDESSLNNIPVEATLLQAESASTARLFASVLQSNSQHSESLASEETLWLAHPSNSSTPAKLPIRIYRTVIDPKEGFRTTIAVAKNHVVQVTANIEDSQLLDEYAVEVLRKLSYPELPDNKLSLRSISSNAVL